MQDRRSIGQMPRLSRHLGFSAVERHEEKHLWTIIVLLLQALVAAAMVVSMLHPVMVQALAFIVQLIEHANSLRVTVIGQRRNFNNVRVFIIYSIM